jgi:hypothetical protein
MAIDAILRQRLAQSVDPLGERADSLREIDVRVLLERLSEALRAPPLDDVADGTIAGPIDGPVPPVGEVIHAFRDAPCGFPLCGLLLEALLFGDAGIDGVNRPEQILNRDLLDFELLVAADLLRLEFRPSFSLIDVERGHEVFKVHLRQRSLERRNLHPWPFEPGEQEVLEPASFVLHGLASREQFALPHGVAFRLFADHDSARIAFDGSSKPQQAPVVMDNADLALRRENVRIRILRQL